MEKRDMLGAMVEGCVVVDVEGVGGEVSVGASEEDVVSRGERPRISGMGRIVGGSVILRILKSFKCRCLFKTGGF